MRLATGFFLDYYFYRGGHVAVQLDGHGELAQSFKGFIKQYFAAVHFKAASVEFTGDIAGGDGTEELVMLGRLAGEIDDESGELLGKSFGIALVAGGAAQGRGLHLLNHGAIATAGFN